MNYFLNSLKGFKLKFILRSIKNDEIFKNATSTRECNDYEFLNEKQNELQMYKNKLDEYTSKINRVGFLQFFFN
jgi:hypothetical protein